VASVGARTRSVDPWRAGSVSEEDAVRRAREELARLEAERVRLSAEVMEGRPGALEQDEQIRQRIVELGQWLLEVKKERC
jgi:hypothetical protein